MKPVQKIFASYLLQTQDKELVLTVLVKSLYNLNWKVRLTSLNLISALFTNGLNGVHAHQLKSLSSALNYLKSDSASSVASAAQVVLKEFFSNLNPTPAPLAFNPTGIGEPAHGLDYLEGQNGLVFNLVEKSIIEEIEDESNWRARSLAIQKLENSIDELESMEKLVPYLAIFLRLIAKLIKDKNFKVSETALSISEKLIKCRQLSSVGNFSLLIPSCIHKLGDNKISIRMTSFRVLKSLLLILRPSVTLPFLLSSLESDNWHIREEVVGLIITSLLLKLDYDYSEAIEPLAKLLDDSRPKVKTVTMEAFAVLSSQDAGLLSSLRSIVDASALERLQARLQNKQLASMTEDYIEYPKLVLSIPSASVIEDTREEIFSARLDFPTKTQEISIEVKRPVSQLKSVQSVAKSYNFLPRRVSPIYTSDSKPDSDCYYLPSDQLQPVKNPHDQLQRIMNREDNWEAQFEAVNVLRRLTKHHPEVFFSKVTLHNVVLDVVKWADSLRSSLAKNSLILLQEMCVKLRKSMDSEISELFKILLRKVADTNAFITKQAEITLEAMVNELSEQKVVGFVLFYCSNAKIPVVKAQLALCFVRIFKKAKENVAKIRDLEKTLQVLAEYLIDAANEVRKASLAAFEELAKAVKSESELDLVLMRSMKDSLYQRVKAALSRMSRSQSPVKSVSEPRLKQGTFKLRRHFPKFTNHKTSEEFDGIFRKILEKDWKSRFDSISLISEASKTTSFNLNQTEQIVNTLCIGMNDVNIKVQIHTLSTLKKLIPSLRSLLNPYLSQLTGELCKLLNNQSLFLRESVSECFPLFSNYCDLEMLVIAIINSIKLCKSRGRICLLRFFNSKVKQVCEEDLMKFVDCLCENCEYPRQDVRAEAETCLLSLYGFLDEKLFQFVSDGRKELVVKVIENMN